MSNIKKDTLTNLSFYTSPSDGVDYIDKVTNKEERHGLAFLPGSISGVQAVCSILLPFFIKDDTQTPLVRLPGLVEVNLSDHKDVYPVFSNSQLSFKSFTEGHLTEAGSLIFNIIEEHPFSEVMNRYNKFLALEGKDRIHKPQNLPPLDAIIVFTTRSGQVYGIQVSGIKIVDSNINISMEARPTMSTVSFICKKVRGVNNLDTRKKSLPSLSKRERLLAVQGGGSETSTAGSSTASTSSATTVTTGSATTTATTASLTTTTAPTTTTVTVTTTTTVGTTHTPPTVTGIGAEGSPPLRAMLLQLNVDIDPSDSTWYDTGVLLTGNEEIVLECSTNVLDGVDTCYSEGKYPGAYPGYDPSQCLQTYSGGTGTLASDNCRPWSMVAAISLTTPGRSILDGRQINATYSEKGAVGKLWLQFNDKSAQYGDNTGTHTVDITVYQA